MPTLDSFVSEINGNVVLDAILPLALRLLLILVVGVVIIDLLLGVLDRVLKRAETVVSLRVYIRGAVKTGLWFLLLLILADSAGVEVTSLVALLGVAGLSVSLALQNTLSNLAGGVQVLATKPFAVDDYVDTPQGSGTVSEVGLAYTKLVTPDNKEILIPNSQVASANIVNYTALGKRRMDVNLNLSYDSEMRAVRAAALEVLARYPQVLPEPEPVVRLTAYKENHVEYSIRAWVGVADYWDVYFGVMEEIRAGLNKHGADMTYNHLKVHLIAPPENR